MPEPSPNPPQTNSTQPKSLPSLINTSFLSYAAEAPKYVVLALFFLYLIGFIIWHSYLANFGIYPEGVLQLDFLSAALCYLFITAAIAFPAALLIHSLTNLKTVPISPALYFICAIWALLLVYLQLAFFASANFTLKPLYFIAPIALAHGLYLLAFRKLKEQRKLYALLNTGDVFGFYILFYVFANLCFTNSVSKLFLIPTLAIFGPLPEVFKICARDTAKFPNLPRHRFTLNLMYAFMLTILIATHIFSFGKFQFQHIPRCLGGGKPEDAFLKLSPNSQDIPTSLSIPTTNGLLGPVNILMKNAHQIIFLQPPVPGSTNTRRTYELRADLVDTVIFLPLPPAGLWHPLTNNPSAASFTTIPKNSPRSRTVSGDTTSPASTLPDLSDHRAGVPAR